MPRTLVGTGALLRLGLRRDRWLLPSWVGAFALMAGFAAGAGEGLFPDEAARIEAAKALNSTASMVAMFGRVYDPTSLGALSMIKYTAFMTAAVAVLMVFVTIRHSRAEEETGRLELVSGGRVGRNAPLAAALIISLSASLVLGLLTAGALAAGGLPGEGSLAFGLGWAVTGMAFCGVAAVAAQITTTSRAATGIGVSAIAIAYILRGIGDMADPGPSAFSWISPIGWNQQIRAFAGDRWWVLALPLALCVALVPMAFLLRARRDLGGGLRADRPGPAHGALRGVGGLAIRLQNRVFAAWAVGVIVFGLIIGSLVDSISDFLSSSTAIDLIKKIGGDQILTDAFLAAEIGLVGIMISAFGLTAVNRLRSEENVGHAEALMGTSTTRARWATSHYLTAIVGVALLLLLLGLSVGAGAAVALGDGSQVGRITLAALAQAPAAWVIIGLAFAVFGWAPRFTGWVWGFLMAFIALGEFGVLWGVPQWLMNVAPYQHSPRLPIDKYDLRVLVVLSAVAAVLAALGYLGWRRRDLALS